MLKSLYLHIPRTGGISIKNTGFDILFINEHKFAKDVENIGDYFTFCFVRNPYDRFLSSYFFYKNNYKKLILKHNGRNISDSIKKYKNFNEFCLDFDNFEYNNDLQFFKQTNFVYDNAGNKLINYVGKFENLQNDWNEICKIIGINENILIKMNNTEHDYWEKYYNSESIEIINKYFYEDFISFNYTILS